MQNGNLYSGAEGNNTNNHTTLVVVGMLYQHTNILTVKSQCSFNPAFTWTCVKRQHNLFVKTKRIEEKFKLPSIVPGTQKIAKNHLERDLGLRHLN